MTEHLLSVSVTLLFQDLATLPFLVLVAALGMQAGSGAEAVETTIWQDLARRLLVAAAGFALVVVVGRHLLVKIVAHLATLGSREVFMLAVLLLVLAAALAAHEVGISPPLGAFLAGMILGETQFKHQVEEDIRPFRDVLLGLFFISVGLRVDLTVVLEYWLTVLDLLGVLVPLKGVIIYLIACLLREPSDVALRAATILAHGGEFSLLILTLALSQDALPPEVVQPLLGAVVLSMIAAPFLIRENERIALTITARAPNRSP